MSSNILNDNDSANIYHVVASTEMERAQLNAVSMLPVKISRDENMYCVLWGENLQQGVAGFGETPMRAILDFNNNLYNSPK